MRKILVFLFLILVTNLAFADTTTPRESFRTFLKAMVQIKENQGNSGEAYEKAISTLDLSSFSAPAGAVGRKLSDDLIKVLDKIKKVDYDLIPETTDQPYWVFDQRAYKEKVLEISLIQVIVFPSILSAK